MKIAEIILNIRQMNMNASVVKKEDPKRFWLAMFRIIAGGLFFFTMFLHFYNAPFFGPINAFTWPSSDWLYILVFVGIILVYYGLEFSNNQRSLTLFKVHTILASIHWLSMLYVVFDSGATIRLWAFVQLLVIVLMVILAWFPNLIMNLKSGSSKPKKPKKEEKLEEVEEVEYVEVSKEDETEE